jgi:hypothetical protein
MSIMDWSSADSGRVIIVPFDGATIATVSQIISIAAGQTLAEENAWSPDGQHDLRRVGGRWLPLHLVATA